MVDKTTVLQNFSPVHLVDNIRNIFSFQDIQDVETNNSGPETHNHGQ
jgi:hypothetical protein